MILRIMFKNYIFLYISLSNKFNFYVSIPQMFFFANNIYIYISICIHKYPYLSLTKIFPYISVGSQLGDASPLNCMVKFLGDGHKDRLGHKCQ